MMRVADYLANYIAKLGVKNVFMLSGTGSVHLDDAFAFQKILIIFVLVMKRRSMYGRSHC